MASIPLTSRRAFLCGTLAAALPGLAVAQTGADYPSRPLSLVVPVGAGSTTDILARILARGLGDQLGQPVVVDNRAGGGGTVGVGYVARSRADGYTLGLVTSSFMAINPALYRNLNFSPHRDLTVIGISSATSNALVVAGNSDWRSMADLAAAARRTGVPPMRYFSPGNGTSQHLSAVQLQRLLGVTMEHIPYRGPSEALTGLLAGESAFGFATVPSIAGLVRDGRARVLGTTGTRSSSLLTGVQPLAAQGYPDYSETDIWYGIAAPRGLPDDADRKLRDALRGVLGSPEINDQIARAGFDRFPDMTQTEADAFVTRQVAFWGDLVRQSGAVID